MLAITGYKTDIIPVVHALSIRTQDKALINSLTNDARQAITDSIRDLHEWCVEIICKISTASVDDVLIRAGIPHARSRRIASIREHILDGSSINWAKRLEEYECLFPETALVRIELLNMHGKMFNAVRSYTDSSEQTTPSTESPEQAKCLDILYDYLGLTWDLMVHVQNKCIGSITGHNVPERQVRSGEHARLALDHEGNLKVFRQTGDGTG